MIVAFGTIRSVKSLCDSKNFDKYARLVRETCERVSPEAWQCRRELSDRDFIDDCSRQNPQIWQLDPGERTELSMEMPDGAIWMYAKAIRNRDGSMLLHHVSGTVEGYTNKEYLVEMEHEQRRQG